MLHTASVKLRQKDLSRHLSGIQCSEPRYIITLMAKLHSQLLRNYSGSNPKAATLVLRLGLVFVFGYAAISAFQTPEAWLPYMPGALTKVLQGNESLHVFSVLQLGLAAWLLSGKYVKFAAAIAALMLAGVVVSNFASMLIVFRDVGLLCMAVALYLLA